MKIKNKKIRNLFLPLFFALVLLFFSGGKVYAGSCTYSTGCVEVTTSSAACTESGGTYSSKSCAELPTSTSTSFPNPIGFETVSALLNSILDKLMGIIAIVAVIFIVIGGVMYMTSGGNEAMITRAKKTWTYAVIGLAIALAAPTFLREIYDILGKPDPGIGGITLKEIATNVLNLLLSIIGIVAIIALVAGGGMYLTAYGDEKKIDTSKKVVTYAVIGITVALASLVIVRQVSNLISGS